MGALISNHPVRLEALTCASCGVEFAAPEHMLDEKRKTAGSVFCPNGHSIGWRVSEAEKLRKQLDERERQLKAAQAEREFATKRAEKAEDSNRRLKVRAKNGVCPCCKRTFKQLAAHMKTKHPEFE